MSPICYRRRLLNRALTTFASFDPPRFSPELADLVDKLLTLDPQTRLTADEALDHDWFWTDPLPAEAGSVQSFPSSHEYDKRKAQEERHGHGGEKAKAAQEAAFRGPNQLVKIPGAAQAQPPPMPPPRPMQVHPQQVMQGQQVAAAAAQWARPAMPPPPPTVAMAATSIVPPPPQQQIPMMHQHGPGRPPYQQQPGPPMFPNGNPNYPM